MRRRRAARCPRPRPAKLRRRRRPSSWVRLLLGFFPVPFRRGAFPVLLIKFGREPEQASADAGYCSEANLEALEAHRIDGYVAPGRAKHPTAENGKVGGPLTQAMRMKIDDGGFETPYRLRKQVVEPVFGQIKQARGFRQFLLRGVEKVRAEWAMICTAHNLLKLFTLANAA